jgi:hypothetical protein
MRISGENTKVLKKSAKRLAAYSAAAVATFLSSERPVNAAEVVHDIPDLTVGVCGNIWFDLESGSAVSGVYCGNLSNPPLSDGFLKLRGKYTASGTANNPYLYGDRNDTGTSPEYNFRVVGGSYSYDEAANLDSGDLIGNGGQSFGFGQYTSPIYTYAWADIGDHPDWGGTSLGADNTNTSPTAIHGFVGIEFKIGSARHYGWIEVTRAPGDVEGTITLHAFGYDDTAGSRSIAGGNDPDINSDGIVDGLDVGILLGHWGGTENSAGGELNNTATVNGLDLGILLGSWDAAPVSAAPVPEPTSVILLAAGAAGIAAWRRGKQS